MFNIGLQLRKTRKKCNLTLDQLAATSGVDRGTISRIELGHVSPRIDTIGFLCEAMNTSLSQFFGLPDGVHAPEADLARGAFGPSAENGHVPGAHGFAGPDGAFPGDGTARPPLEGYWPVPSTFWRGLLEVLERFEILVKNSHELILVQERSGLLLYLSPPCETLLGFRPQELLGHRLHTLVHPEDQPGFQACLDTLLQLPGSSLELEYRVRRQDRSWCRLASRFTNQLDNPNVRAVVVNAISLG